MTDVQKTGKKSQEGEKIECRPGEKLLSVFEKLMCSMDYSLPARASEQGNVIGLVSVYIYIYIYMSSSN